MQLDVEQINIDDVVPAPYNPRDITKKELTKLERNIKEFGLADPIIINLKNNHIIGGHQRYKALLKQGLTTLNLIKLGNIGWLFNETEMNIENENDEKILNLSLNNISGTWNPKKLGQVLSELKQKNANYKLTGFDDLDIERLKIDTEILVDQDLLRTTSEKLQNNNTDYQERGEGYSDRQYQNNEEQELRQLHDGIIKDEGYERPDEEIPCPHCGKPISLEMFMYDIIDRADGLD